MCSCVVISWNEVFPKIWEIWGIVYFNTMDGLFWILEKTSFQLKCTLLYIIDFSGKWHKIKAGLYCRFHKDLAKMKFNLFHLSFQAKDSFFCELATAWHCTGAAGMMYCKHGSFKKGFILLYIAQCPCLQYVIPRTSAVPGSSKLTKVRILGSER